MVWWLVRLIVASDGTAFEELDVLPSHRSVPRKNRRGGSELTPSLSAQDGEAPPADLIESAQPEDLIEEDVRDVRDAIF